jgi:hypothetical protein
MLDEASRPKIIFSEVDHSRVVKPLYRDARKNKKKTAEQEYVNSVSAVFGGSQDSPRKKWIVLH